MIIIITTITIYINGNDNSKNIAVRMTIITIAATISINANDNENSRNTKGMTVIAAITVEI